MADRGDRPDIVLFGDSITFAWPIPGGEEGRRRHRGIPGETSLDMLRRFDADVVAAAPRIVHVMAGTNDVAGNGGGYDEDATVAAIAAMADRARRAGIRVLIGSTPPAGAIFWNPGIDSVARIRSLNVALRRLARRIGAGFVDYDEALGDGGGAMRAGLADDGVHPNAAGYAAMEARLRAAIDRESATRGWFRRRPAR